MNFDTKYLIRWGIPGWVFIIFVGGVFICLRYSHLKDITINISGIFGLLVSLGFFGVTLGYLMHQIYFSINWNSKKKNEHRIIDEAVGLVDKKEKIKNYNNHIWGNDYHSDYYLFEFLWHNELLKLKEEKRNYIVERYRHILSTTHGLGALRISLIGALVMNIPMYILGFFNSEKTFLVFLPVLIILVNYYLVVVTKKGFFYYSSNLNHFQGYFMNEFMNNEYDNSEANYREEDSI
ncbi:hypothetical protein MPH47_04215 [Psychrobacillus psychrodurans]|uniref:hypothetical protein n=1 Tax=Psychrobacillus psychrodurans TaxID=126157 RepID=UPI001F4F0D70|nr:hypothetical protein [Psychrobacillus psychrodurans]MCK1996450.1 hypothetical protein [Psychrobacillus psychrodurans]